MSTALFYDQIPDGTFYASGEPITPEQAAALRYVEEIGGRLVQTGGEILAELARDVALRYEDIAAVLIPDEHEQFPEVSEKAVGFAVRAVIPEDELAELTHTRRSLQMKKQIQAMGEVAFLAHQQAASIKSWENRDRPDVDAMLKGRGRIAWSETEKEVLANLLGDSSYQHLDGPQKGRPNYDLIALELNISFHDCDAVRYSNSVRSMRNEFFKRKT